MLSCFLFASKSLAFNFDSVSAQEFVVACRQLNIPIQVDEESNAATQVNLCQAYLQGYFAGTDEVIAEESLPASFTLRALRARGRRLSDEHHQLLNSPYCISEQETLLDFAEKVAILETEFSTDAAASEVVELILDQNYRCERKGAW